MLRDTNNIKNVSVCAGETLTNVLENLCTGVGEVRKNVFSQRLTIDEDGRVNLAYDVIAEMTALETICEILGVFDDAPIGFEFGLKIAIELKLRQLNGLYSDNVVINNKIERIGLNPAVIINEELTNSGDNEHSYIQTFNCEYIILASQLQLIAEHTHKMTISTKLRDDDDTLGGASYNVLQTSKITYERIFTVET